MAHSQVSTGHLIICKAVGDMKVFGWLVGNLRGKVHPGRRTITPKVLVFMSKRTSSYLWN